MRDSLGADSEGAKLPLLSAPCRRTGTTFALVVVISSLTACVPSDPVSAPISLTVEDNSVEFRWCGEEIRDLGYLSIEYRTFDPDAGEQTAAEGTGRFSLTHGLTFSTSSPPGRVAFDTQNDIPIVSDRTTVYVYAGATENNISEMAYFDSPGLKRLEPGTWMHPSGELTQVRCDDH